MNLDLDSRDRNPPGEKASAAASQSATDGMVALPEDALIILPVRKMVLFPGMILPIALGREASIAAAQAAAKAKRPVGVLLQRNPETEKPEPDELSLVGTVASIVRYVTTPDGTHHVICQGQQRFRVVEYLEGYPFMAARVGRIEEPEAAGNEIEARFVQLKERALQVLDLLPQTPQELVAAIQGMSSPGALADLVAGVMEIEVAEKQVLLETVDLQKRMDGVLELLAHRLQVLKLSREIDERTKASLDETQRKYLLREQMKSIQKELGEGGEGQAAEIAELKKSIAEAGMPEEVEKQAMKELKRLERMFVRVSLGGVHDEAEIRGHRRTYIGALPGNIIQALKKAGTRGCVMMLDEIDKLGAGFHGDPSSALLEVLDPAQNNTFRDNYLAVPYDLSSVLFITTANVLDTIPGPLRDRMEIIQLPGYTQEEKLEIAKRYLLRRQLEANGLASEQAGITEDAIRKIISDYTREAGVRNLEREIGAALRSAAMQIAEGKAQKVVIEPKDLHAILGARKFEGEVAERTAVPGVATGLAWTPVGGDILFIEASQVPGTGKLILTGQLGDVMKESAQAALTLAKSFLGEPLDKVDIHIHVPAGATPKDGPSAGVAMFLALVSLHAGLPVRPDVAMTGEISLRGLVLPIGGVKEKTLAALRAGIKTVMLPKRNEKDLEDVPAEARRKLEFVFLEKVEEAVRTAIGELPKAGAKRAAA